MDRRTVRSPGHAATKGEETDYALFFAGRRHIRIATAASKITAANATIPETAIPVLASAPPVDVVEEPLYVLVPYTPLPYVDPK
jgi:hypothetical protein